MVEAGRQAGRISRDLACCMHACMHLGHSFKYHRSIIISIIACRCHCQGEDRYRSFGRAGGYYIIRMLHLCLLASALCSLLNVGSPVLWVWHVGNRVRVRVQSEVLSEVWVWTGYRSIDRLGCMHACKQCGWRGLDCKF